MRGTLALTRRVIAARDRRWYGRSGVMRILVAVVLASLLILSGCGRLLHPSGQPTPGPTSSPSPTGTGIAGGGGGDEGADEDPADEAVTDGPDVTG
jgi:hypothetical protein